MTVTIPTYVITKIKECTALNDHNCALLILASALNLEKFVKIIKAIMTIHDAEGDMPAHLWNYRYEVGKEVMKCASRILSSDNFATIKAAF